MVPAKSRVKRKKIQILGGGGVVLVSKRDKFVPSTDDGILTCSVVLLPIDHISSLPSPTGEWKMAFLANVLVLRWKSKARRKKLKCIISY